MLTLAPVPLETTDPHWEKLKSAKLEALAEVLELHRDEQIYFLARDMEYFYDLAKVMLGGTEDAKRIHLLNVSRVNAKDTHLPDYLAQEGLDSKALAAGRKALLFDTGFIGTISRAIEAGLPVEASDNLRTQLLVSANARHGSTRSFLRALGRSDTALDPAAMFYPLVDYEKMPRYTDRSDSFQHIDGRWEPVSSGKEEADGVVDRANTKRYMADLRHFGEQPKTRSRFDELRGYWRGFLSSVDKADMIGRLKEHLRKDRYLGEARVRDMVEYLTLKDSPLKPEMTEFGLAPIYSGFGPKQLLMNALFDKHPQWEAILANVQYEIPNLVAKGDYQTLGNMMDTIQDVELDRAILFALNTENTPQRAALISALIKKGTVDATIASYVLSRDHWKDHPEWAKALIKKGTVDSHLAYVLASWEGNPELIEALIEKETVDGLLVGTIRNPSWSKHPERVSYWASALELKGPERKSFLNRNRPYN